MILFNKYLNLFIFFFCCANLLYRVNFGIDIIDEAWYFGENFLVSQGAVPFVDNFSHAPGVTFPLSLCYKLFILFNGGDTSGIVLFSRYLFVFWEITILLLVFYFVKKIDNKFSLIFLVPLLYIFSVSPLFHINYNTIGQYYLPLFLVLVIYSICNCKHLKTKYYILFFCGVLIARTVIATPSIFVSVVIVFVILLCYRKYKEALVIAFGGLFFTCLLLFFILSNSSFEKLVSALKILITDWPYQHLGSTNTFFENLQILIYFLIPAVLFIILSICFKLICFRILTNYLFLSFIQKLLVLLPVTVGLCCLLQKDGYEKFIQFSWFIPIVIRLIYSLKKQILIKINVINLILFVYFVTFVCSSLLGYYGFSMRRYYFFLVPIVLSYYSIILVLPSKIYQVFVYSSLLAISTLLSFLLYKNSYDLLFESKFNALDNTVKINEGIYKGLYTNTNYYPSIVELECYLKKITNNEDDILYLDWASFGYVMGKGNGLTPSAIAGWEAIYNYNNPNYLLEYFCMKKKFPTKIIYVDYSYDCTYHISIVRDNWLFNKFVKSNYIQKSTYINSLFKVIVYDIKNKSNPLKNLCLCEGKN